MGTNEVEIQCTKNSLFRLSVLPALKVVCAYGESSI